MKRIRSIRFIDLYTYTDDYSLEYVIDITSSPYFYPHVDITQNLIDIGKIIYNKSINLGFTKLQSSIFAKKAIIENMKQFNVDYDPANIVMKIYNDKNKSRISSKNTYFYIEKNNKSEFIIHDYNPSIMCLLKELGNVSAKFIKLSFNLIDKKVIIAYCSNLNKIIDIMDTDISDNILKIIKSKNKNLFAINVLEEKNSLNISLFDHQIFELTKVSLRNIIQSIELKNLDPINKTETLCNNTGLTLNLVDKSNQKELNKKELNKKEFNKKEFNKKEFNKKEFNKKELNKKEFNKKEFNKKEFNKKELNPRFLYRI